MLFDNTRPKSERSTSQKREYRRRSRARKIYIYICIEGTRGLVAALRSYRLIYVASLLLLPFAVAVGVFRLLILKEEKKREKEDIEEEEQNKFS